MTSVKEYPVSPMTTKVRDTQAAGLMTTSKVPLTPTKKRVKITAIPITTSLQITQVIPITTTLVVSRTHKLIVSPLPAKEKTQLPFLKAATSI